jgi:hypothetical protein
MASMGPYIMIASALAGVNVVLLGVLTAVWVRNYRTFRSELIAGLVAFGAVMLVENAVAIYFFFSMETLYSGDPTVQQVVALLRGLQAVALTFLTYVSMR